MAAVLDVEKPDAYLYAEIVKCEEQDDGSVIVYGRPSQEVLDIDDQIADKEWLKQALPEWMQWGNIREMHQPNAVGVAQSLEFDANDDPWLRAKIVDPIAVKKVREGVYKGYSLGIRKPVLKRDPKAPKGRFVGGKIVEVSLVDRPAVPTARFEIIKCVGGNEWLDCQAGLVFEDLTGKVGNIHDPSRGNSEDFDSQGNPILQPGHLRTNEANAEVVEIGDEAVIVRVGQDLFRVPFTADSSGQFVFGEPEQMNDKAADKGVNHSVEQEQAEKAVWSTEYINNLPDDAFAYIEPGGKKDEEGKTTPRSLRHLPYKDHNGKLDEAHIRDALSRLPQTDIPEEAKEKARKKLEAAAREVGIEVADEEKDKVNKIMQAAEDAVKAAKAAAYCPECRKRVKLGDKVREEDVPGGKRAHYKGECGHMVPKFEKAAEEPKGHKESEAPEKSEKAAGVPNEPPKEGDTRENMFLDRLKAIVQSLESNEHGPDDEGLENRSLAELKKIIDEWVAYQARQHVEGEKGAVPDIKALVADAVKSALAELGVANKAAEHDKKEDGEDGKEEHKGAGAHHIERLKSIHAKLGDHIENLKAAHETLGEHISRLESGTAEKAANAGGPEPATKDDVLQRIRQHLSEADELARIIEGADDGLIKEREKVPGNLGEDNKAVPTGGAKERVDLRRNVEESGSDRAGSDIKELADAVKSALAEAAKSFSVELQQAVLPLKMQIEEISHRAAPPKAEVYLAERPELFGQPNPEIRKAALDEARKQFGQMTPKEQQQFAAQLIAQLRREQNVRI